MADSSFDDDDDEMLMALIQATQAPQSLRNSEIQAQNGLQAPQIQSGQNQLISTPKQATNAGDAAQIQDNNTQMQLFRAQGEIAILRAQLLTLQTQKNDEVARLNTDVQNAQTQAQNHISLLKQSIDKLEDEKRFLGNEIRALSGGKRRKIASQASGEADASENGNSTTLNIATTLERFSNGSDHVTRAKTAPVIRVQDDWALFCLHIWNYTINGSNRSTMQFLSRISVDFSADAGPDMHIEAQTPILAPVWSYLMLKKDSRLDRLVHHFAHQMVELVETLLRYRDTNPGAILVVPFVVSLIHACITFKVSAVDQNLVNFLARQMCSVLSRFVFLLQVSEDEESLFVHNVTYQNRLLETFTLVLCFDVLEDVMAVSTQFGPEFVSKLWALDTIDVGLLLKVLPENTERFMSAAQINLVYNLVEMLSASLVEGRFATSNESTQEALVKSLIKVFLIDISIKDDFMFFGLNRTVGNNGDFDRISRAIPATPDSSLHMALVSLALPVNPPDTLEKTGFRTVTSHEHHLLSLRVRIVNLLESLVVSGSMHLLNQKENIKSIVRIIAFEQNAIMHQPRSQFVHMRLGIVAVLIRILYYITDEHKNINTLIYPETLYEIFVILMRIAFGSDSLSFEAHKLLSEIRTSGITETGVFNRWCEQRSREIAHVNLHDARPNKYVELSSAECDFANGLEFPYELETIEIAREILGVCVNHDEADNLYYNMNSDG